MYTYFNFFVPVGSELIFKPRFNVVPLYIDEGVSITPAMFVVESDDVNHLVLHVSNQMTALLDVDSVR